MVECELRTDGCNIIANWVLIDTWWNVNSDKNILTNIFIIVLIDTWWNVNMNKLCNYSLDGAGFNRYMVECE